MSTTKWQAVETTTGERNPYIVPEGSDSWKVINTEDGQEDRWKYPTQEGAQKRADALNEQDEDDDDLFSAFFDADSQIDYFGSSNTKKAEEPIEKAEPEEEIDLSGQHQIGQEVTVDGVTYIVTDCSCISEQSANDLEDGFDAFVSAGWTTTAVRKHEQTEEKAKWGGRREGAGRKRTYIRVPVHSNVERCGEPFQLSPETPTDPTTAVIAMIEGRHGILIDDRWFGPRQALRLLEYLKQQRNWFEEEQEKM